MDVMYLARIDPNGCYVHGIRAIVLTPQFDERKPSKPGQMIARERRAWRTRNGAAAIDATKQSAIDSARSVLEGS